MPRAPSVMRALRSALRSLSLLPADKAATALALRYAGQIDEGGDIARLGPKLLEALVELGMTPKARAGIQRGASDNGSANQKLDELRTRRERRVGGAG